MYFIFGPVLVLCLCFFLIFYFRRRKIICRIRSMTHCRKITLLNELLEPYGFTYLPTQDILSSTVNAWQRSFGYHALFDRTAAHFNMVFDCEPVYFDYNGQTWLIEFWKGQYGINIGAETGIYHADSVIAPEDYENTQFDSVSDEQMMPISIVLFRGANSQMLSELCCQDCDCLQKTPAAVPLFWISRRHWWLTGFRMGEYCEPEELAMRAAITFPNACMQQSFIRGLALIVYNEYDIRVHGLTVSILFDRPHTAQSTAAHTLIVRGARIKNKCFCRLYQKATKPFTCTADKLLYLYYFLPPVFRHMLKFRKCKKQSARRNFS